MMLSKIATKLGSMFGRKRKETPIEEFLRMVALKRQSVSLTAEPEPVDDETPFFNKPGSWKLYRQTMVENNISGWSFCRFACRGLDDKPTFYLGNAKGDYGVFTISMPVCPEGDDAMGIEPEAVLAQLIHIPTGVGIGVFETRELACKGADLLAPLFPAETELDRTIWYGSKERVTTLFAFYGIAESDRWHAHAVGFKDAIPIWAPVELARPEKLS
jgi:hypothetical protein